MPRSNQGNGSGPVPRPRGVAVRNPRVGPQDGRNVILVASRWRQQGQAQHEMGARQRTHAAQDAKYLVPHADRSRCAARTSVSNALRKRERSCLVSGAGPPVFSPISRRYRPTSRPARALPMLSGVQILPFGDSARPPLARQRDARGMSLVMQTSACVDAFGDPVVGDVGAGLDGDHGHVRPPGRADRPRAVGHDENRQAQPVRDTIDFVADRAGVAVDVERGHIGADRTASGDGAMRQSTGQPRLACTRMGYAAERMPRLPRSL